MSGDASQRVLLSAVRGEEQLTGVLSAADPAWNEPAQASAWRSFARFIGEGVWHVLIGYDHIAFVLLLLLPSVMRPVDGKWQGASGLPQVARDMVTIITAFTIAHSITLALAVTGTVKVPTQPIEIAIAASIAVAGGLNLLPRLSKLRLPLAFGFGLVHGFGFANALSEIDAAGSVAVAAARRIQHRRRARAARHRGAGAAGHLHDARHALVRERGAAARLMRAGHGRRRLATPASLDSACVSSRGALRPEAVRMPE